MITPSVRLSRRLGAGGMGSVWVADHLALHTEVVVKFMSVELLDNPEALARFKREAAAASQVKSPHVVHTLDYGVTERGTPYIVMELLEGEDLGHRLETRGKLPPQDALSIVVQLARALGKAHERGIVHRDIKPNNIFLCDAGGGDVFVKLLDFGIAKAENLPLLSSTTRTGSIVGSPFYMSPEQVVGDKEINHLTDLWSLGVVTYEALTGDKPFFAETLGGIAIKIHHDPLPNPSEKNPELPPTLDGWFRRACARDPRERFASAKEMADALGSAIAGVDVAPGIEFAATVASRPPARLSDPRLAQALPDSVAGVSAIDASRSAKVLRPSRLAFGLLSLAAGGLAVIVFVLFQRGAPSGERPSAVPPSELEAVGPSPPAPRAPSEPALAIATPEPEAAVPDAGAASAPAPPSRKRPHAAKDAPRPPAPPAPSSPATPPTAKPPAAKSDDIF